MPDEAKQKEEDLHKNGFKTPGEPKRAPPPRPPVRTVSGSEHFIRTAATGHASINEATRRLLARTSIAGEAMAGVCGSDTPSNVTPPSTVSSNSSSATVSAQTSPRISARATTLDVPGLTKSRVSPDGRIASRDVGAKLVIVMVGLPARGKSYIVKKLERYYNWLGHRCKTFNVGNRRRLDTHNTNVASFFDPDNAEFRASREGYAKETFEELLKWILVDNGSVGIFDATNSTLERRQYLISRVHKEPHLKIFFIESICTDQELLETNMRLKLRGPDYRKKDPEASLSDFKERVRNYEKTYVPLGDFEERQSWLQYCKVINVGRKVIAYNIQGFLAAQAVFFMLNFNLADRLIFVARHGESTDNAQGRIGGNAPLSENGKRFAKALYKFVNKKRIEFRQNEIAQFSKKWSVIPVPGEKPPNPGTVHSGELPPEKSFSVWTSLLERGMQTANDFDEDIYDVKAMKMLDEISAGAFEGMTHEEIRRKYPEEYELRAKDQLTYRYPGSGGESYLDVIHRLSSVIVEIERMDHHVLLIGHRVTTRIVLAYFLGLDQDKICSLDVPQNTVYMLEPKPYGTELYRYTLDPDSDEFVGSKFEYVPA